MPNLLKIWIHLRSSLWFLPAVMVVCSGALAILMVDLDTRFESELGERWPRLFGVNAEGARGILSAIASSMITVTGVVFSVVIVALSLASNQYTPRVLRNFMRDKGTQLVLGVFVSVFTYSLLVMRTVRAGDNSFVPSIAIGTAILLALIAVAFLIYFIHHIADGIQASAIVATITRETTDSIRTVYPDRADDQSDFANELVELESKATIINCQNNGYLQTISKDLAKFAAKHNVVLRVEKRIGDFMMEGTPLVSVLGGKVLNEEQAADVQEFFSVDTYRTIEQDPGYGIRQLVDISLKALSPGINDNATAANCLDHIGLVLSCLVRREDRPRLEVVDGKPRVIWCPYFITTLIDEALVEIRQNARANGATIQHMLRMINHVLDAAKKEQYRVALLHHVDLLEELTRQTIQSDRDRQTIMDQMNELRSKHQLPGTS